MSEEPITEPASEDETPRGVGGYLYRLALAGVGAVMLAQDELEARFTRRVETPSQEGEPLPVGTPRPSDPSSDEAPVVREGEDGATEDGGAPRVAFFSQIDATVASFLNKLVPGRAEFEELSGQLESLEAELESLKQE